MYFLKILIAAVITAVLGLSASAIAATPSDQDVERIMKEKGFLPPFNIHRSDSFILVHGQRRLGAGAPRTQEVLALLHNEAPDETLISYPEKNTAGREVASPRLYRELAQVPVIRSSFHAMLDNRCPGTFKTGKPRGIEFVFHYLLNWTFSDFENYEPPLFMTRLKNVAPVSRNNQQTCGLSYVATSLELNRVRDYWGPTNAAEICIERYMGGQYGPGYQKRLTLAEAQQKCPSSAALENNPLAKRGFMTSSLIADTSRYRVYSAQTQPGAGGSVDEFVIEHKGAENAPLIPLTVDEYGERLPDQY